MSSLIQACISNGHCSLERLSESTDAYRAQKKSGLLQKAKRRLTNKWTDWDTFYLPFVRQLLQIMSAKEEIVYIIDGSQKGSANTTLRLSVLCKGFAIPVALVVKEGEKGYFPEEMHLDLLKMIVQVCPFRCRTILLGDREFDGHGLRQWCDDKQWSFVIRTSSDRLIDFDGETARFDTIITTRAIYFIQGAPNFTNAVYWKGKGYQKALFLLTNLELGQETCHYYKRRFKIETLFKYLKSAGFYLHKTRLKCPTKLANLIIVVAFSCVISFCIGLTIKEKEPISTIELIVRKDRLPKITPIAIAQLAIRYKCSCALVLFSELSENLN